ncbi:MAG TPA: VOC family protein [Anaerolineales bacterium]|nr:VOC family protein [Anaerolineales bacterium]
MSTFTITHVEWDTTDPIGLKDFLSGVFGWQFAPFGDTYFMHNAGGEGVSVGVNKNERAVIGNGTPNVYVDVKSIDETLAKAQSLGGGVAVPKTSIEGMGSYAFVKAPDGNLIGLFETNR